MSRYGHEHNDEDLYAILTTVDELGKHEEADDIIQIVHACEKDKASSAIITLIIFRCIEMRYKESMEALVTAYPTACFNILDEDTLVHRGMSPFHLGIINNERKLVNMMLSSLDNVKRMEMLELRAKITLSKDPRMCAPELPTNLAAVTGNIHILMDLINYGADLAGSDSNSDNILHSLVRPGSTSEDTNCEDLFEKIIREVVPFWASITDRGHLKHTPESTRSVAALRMLFYSKNKDGLTPLALSIILGNKRLMGKILSVDQVYRFQFSQMGCFERGLYDVGEFEMDGNGSPGLLEGMSFTDNEQVNLCLTQPVVKNIASLKIYTYKPLSICYGVTCFISTLIYTWSVILTVLPQLCTRNHGDNRTDSSCSADPEKRFEFQSGDYILITFEIILGTQAVIWIWNIYFKIWRRNGLGWASLVTISHVLQLDFLLSYMLSGIIYLGLKASQSHVDVIFLSLNQLYAWCSVYLLCRLRKNTAFFTTMLHYVVLRDVRRFILMIMVTIIAFTMTFMALLATQFDVTASLNTPMSAVVNVILHITGYDVISEDFVPNGNIAWMVKYLTLLFMLMINVLFVNLLIAAMNFTYNQINSLAEVLCFKVLLKDLLTVESTFSFLHDQFKKRFYKKIVFFYVSADGIQRKRRLLLLKVEETTQSGQL